MELSKINKISFIPKDPHCALFLGQTGAGKTVFCLDLLETYFKDVFHHLVIICPTINDNKTYQERAWIKKDKEVYQVIPNNNFNDILKYFHEKFKNEPTLFLIDDCSAERDLTIKKKELSKLAFSGRHTGHSVWILTQKYNSVLTDFREQIRWLVMFKCKDKDTFDECLKENDVIETKEEKEFIRKKLKEKPYTKLIICNDVPTKWALL